MLKIKWSNRIMNYEVSQRVKEERFRFKILKKRTPLLDRANNSA
jgi:hypothetical protein